MGAEAISCPRCGRSIEKPTDYCPHCGAVLKGAPGGTGETGVPDETRAFQTEVLQSDDDYQDTVVYSTSPFNPALFTGQHDAVSAEPQESASGSYPSGSSWSTGDNSGYTWQSPYGTAPYGAPDPTPKSNRGMLLAIVILSLVVCVGLVVGLVALLGPKPEDATVSTTPPVTAAAGASVSSSSSVASEEAEQEESDSFEKMNELESEESESSSSSGSGIEPARRNGGGSSGGSSKGLSDSEAYKRLVEFYNDAIDYDGRISSCAKDFNSSCLDESKQVRSGKAATASNLKRQVRSSWDAIKALDVPFWSVNMDAWQDLCTCYEYLWHRIDVIDRAWNVSLAYDKPKKYENEILGVLRAEMDSSGNNKYYNQFNKLFPTITLRKP